MEAADGFHACSFLLTTRPLAYTVLAVASRNRHSGKRRNVADVFRTGRKFRSRNNGFVTLRASRTTFHASTRIGIPVLVRSRVAIGECLQEGYDLILLLISQSELAGGH